MGESSSTEAEKTTETIPKEDIASYKCEERVHQPQVGVLLVKKRKTVERSESTLFGTKVKKRVAVWYQNQCTATRVSAAGTKGESSESSASAAGISEETEDSEYILTAAHCFQKIKWKLENKAAQHPLTQYGSLLPDGFVFCAGWDRTGGMYTKKEVMTSGCVPITQYWIPYLWRVEELIKEAGYGKYEWKDTHYKSIGATPAGGHGEDFDVWRKIEQKSHSFDYAVAKVIHRGPAFKMGIVLPSISLETCKMFGYPGSETLHQYTLLRLKETLHLRSHDLQVYDYCTKSAPGTSGGPIVCDASGEGYITALNLGVVNEIAFEPYVAILTRIKVKMIKQAIHETEPKEDLSEDGHKLHGMHMIDNPLRWDPETMQRFEKASKETSSGDVHMFDGNSLYDMELISISLFIVIIGCLFCVLCWLIGLLFGYFSYVFCPIKEERVCKTFVSEESV